MFVVSRKYSALGFLLLVVLLAACGSNEQKAAETPSHTIGVVNYLPNLETALNAFKEELTVRGYVEGQNITYVYNGPVSGNDAIDQEIQKLMGQDISLFLVLGTGPARRMKEAIKDTNNSAVFLPVTNAAETGLIENARRPGGRMTGVDVGGPLVIKGLEWLLTVAPEVKRVYVLHLPNEPTALSQQPMLQATADQLKIELVFQETASTDAAITALDSLSPGTDAIYIIAASAIEPSRLFEYFTLAAQQGIPTGTSLLYVPNGALSGIITSPLDYSKQAARLMDQIMQGSDPGSIPVEYAEYTFGINLAIADTLGLTIPDDVLRQASTIVRADSFATPTPIP